MRGVPLLPEGRALDQPGPPRRLPHHAKEFNVRDLKNFLVREEGQDLVEYALLAALLSIVSIAALKTLGPKIAATWNSIAGEL